MTMHMAWQIGGAVAPLAFLVWIWRRCDVGALSGTIEERPADAPWEEQLGGDGAYRYGRAQRFNPTLAEQDARARAGELDRHGGNEGVRGRHEGAVCFTPRRQGRQEVAAATRVERPSCRRADSRRSKLPAAPERPRTLGALGVLA